MFKKLKRSAEGARVPHEKTTASMATVVMPVAEKSTVVIPMSMHIGAPAAPVVKKGDAVKVGTLIGQAGGFVSANIHASVSGVVTEVGPVPMPNGTMCMAVTIEADGQQARDEGCVPPTITDKDSLLKAVQACGLVGLGGAGFPAHVKLSASGIEYLVINGAECEPFLTPDTREFLENSDTVVSGIEAVMKYCDIKSCIIGIESNKPECIELMSKLTSGMKGVSVKALPQRYPQGAEKTLIESCTGREVPKVGPTGKPGLPADAGCVVMNVTSISTLGKFLKTGLPLVSKRLTVDGDAAAKPMNVQVPIGTRFKDLIQFAGGVKDGVKLGKVISGGPMMGLAMFGTDYPVLKQNNGLILLSVEAGTVPEPTPCIRCARCIDGCPMGLEPVNIVHALNAKDAEELGALNIDLCVSCGSCSFICPAKRPLTPNMKLAKNFYLDSLKAQGGK